MSWSQQSPTHIFHLLLGNSLVAGIINAFAWFALTYRVFLETKSIIATSLIAWIFAVSNAISAAYFGNIVDHNKKQTVMFWSSGTSLAFYLLSCCIFFLAPAGEFTDGGSPWLWALIITIMFWSVTGNLRAIALATTVSLLIPEEEHAQANGKIGMVNGVSFTLTSIASGLVIGFLGMDRALCILVVGCVLVLLHLSMFTVPEVLAVQHESETKKLDLKTTLLTVQWVPGLLALIFFTTFNNFLGGVFMALMDAYGLLLVSVQTWWVLWWVLSLAFIAWGLLITKYGLWKNPLKTLFMINIITWTVCIFFTIQASIVLMAIGMFIWLICAPFVEAAESTVIQKVVPYEKQWRVFGFAQSVESAASPLTTFLIGPITQLYFIPLMTTGLWAQLVGHRFGTGIDRGIAVVFILAGIIWLCVTLLAFASRYYKVLSKQYLTE